MALPARSPAIPEVPTTKEAGLPEFQVTAWNAIFAPKGTPPEVVATLNGALIKALEDPATKKRLLDLGADLDRDDPPGRATGDPHPADWGGARGYL